MRVLLITPPFLQCNAPYPATPLLTAWLRESGVEAVQADASLAVLLRLLSAPGLRRAQAALGQSGGAAAGARFFQEQADAYVAWVEPVVRFLQGREPALAYRLVRAGVLPEGPRFRVLRAQELGTDGSLSWAFGVLGTGDQARYLASLFIDDVVAAVSAGIDPGFGLSRYEEKLCQALPSFGPLAERLEGAPTLVDDLIDEVATDLWQRHRPDVVGLTVPFPGTLYGALRLARALRQHSPTLRLAIGGGYVNTELRALADARLFRYVDYVCLDRGFAPLLGVIRHAAGGDDAGLVRTFLCRQGRVALADHQTPEPRQRDLPAPCFEGLPLADYVGLAEMLNPMHVLWSSQRWNKLLAAHGCYWHRCAFCDTELDYIRCFDPAPAARVVDWMEEAGRQTGTCGFHFVDEALPPALVRGLAEDIRRRRLAVTWWGNVRFEPGFDAELAALMAASGCIAVTGGLEALDDRLLGVLNKGVTVGEAVRACAALAEAGLLVHAYLMYGVPSQTAQETVDALERVRQMFARGILHSAYWHRFAATIHSAVGSDPRRFGIAVAAQAVPSFAQNEILVMDPADDGRDELGRGLHRAVYNYMHGREIERDVRHWFERDVPPPRVGRDAIGRLLRGEAETADSAAGTRRPGRLQPRPPRRPGPVR